MSAMTERQADMADDAHGDKTQEEPQAQEDLGQQKAARAMLGDYDGEVDALKAAEPWLFADARTTKPQGGKTGLPNAGTSSDEGKTMKRWRRLAGLDDSDDNA